MPSAVNTGIDSARSWVTAAACFVIQFIGVGSIRGSGVLFVALMEHNRCTREEATWPFTIFGAASIIFAPMTGFLTTVFPIRLISAFGVLLLAVGSSVCFFSTDLYYVSIFYGLLRAAGCSMCVNPIPGIINMSFERHRASAMGFATAGDSVGALVFPLLIQHLLTEYLLKGTFLLLGGIVLQGLLGALLLVQPSHKTSSPQQENIAICETATDVAPSRTEEVVERRQENLGNDEIIRSQAAVENADALSDADDPSSETVLIEKHTVKPCSTRTSLELTPLERLLDGHKHELEGLEDDQNQELQSLTQDREYKQISTTQKASVQNVSKADTKKCCSFDTQILKNILTSRGFYLIQMCQIADSFLVNNYSLLIVDYVGDKGIPTHKGLFMLTVFPIGQLVGRMGLGWITDKNLISRPIYLFFALNLCAGLTLILTYLYDYGALLTCGAVLGVAGGSLHPITAVLLSDYLRREEVHMAVAITISIKGLAQLPRVPLVGYFRDQVGSYDHLFHVTVGVLCLSALVWLCEGIYRRRTTTNERSV